MSLRTTIFSAFTALMLPLAAHAGAGDDLLARVEKSMSNFKDQTIRFQVLNLKPGASSPQSMEFQTKVKGAKSFTEFLAPGDLKGTRVLAMSPTEMYIYLPEFQKIRRVASSTTEQGFMGTVLTQQDMAPPAYAALFTASLDSEDTKSATLTLIARPGLDVTYKMVRMTVDKSMYVPTKLEYYNAAGEVVRTETRTGYKCNASGYCMFASMKMVDHARNGAWTELKPVEVKVDVGLADDIFTQRTLQFGN